ncbi:MAG: hypothetical protein RL179_2679 [Planctomycetota bacterium]
MFVKFWFINKSLCFVCLCLFILGCGTAEYEEQANETLRLVAEMDEADKLLGAPIDVPVVKDANMNSVTKSTFMRLPRENYSRPYPDLVRGNGMALVKYGKAKGGTAIPRDIFVAYSDETEGGVFIEGVLDRFEAKSVKKKTPGVKIKDGLKMDQYYFTNSSSETVHLFVATEEKVAVIFKYDQDKAQVAKQEKVSERSMRTFRLKESADSAKSQWDLRHKQEGGEKKP